MVKRANLAFEDFLVGDVVGHAPEADQEIALANPDGVADKPAGRSIRHLMTDFLVRGAILAFEHGADLVDMAARYQLPNVLTNDLVSRPQPEMADGSIVALADKAVLVEAFHFFVQREAGGYGLGEVDPKDGFGAKFDKTTVLLAAP